MKWCINFIVFNIVRSCHNIRCAIAEEEEQAFEPVDPAAQADVEAELQTLLTEDFEEEVAEEKENPFEPVEPTAEAEAKLLAELDVKDEEDDAAEEKKNLFEPVEPTAQAEVEIKLKPELVEEFEDAIAEEEEQAFEPVEPTWNCSSWGWIWASHRTSTCRLHWRHCWRRGTGLWTTMEQCIATIAERRRMPFNSAFTVDNQEMCVDAVSGTTISYTMTGNPAAPIQVQSINAWLPDELISSAVALTVGSPATAVSLL